MANRFPLIVDSSGTASIKELASGDNLDLTGNGVVGAGTVALTNLTVGGSQGSDGQVLTSTGSGIAWEDAGGGGGGGAWNVMSSQTVSSNVSSVNFTGITGYKVYKFFWQNVVHASHPTYMDFQFSTDNGSNWYTTNGKSVIVYGDSATSSLSVTNRSGWNGGSGRYAVVKNTHQFNTDHKHAGEVTIHSMNDSEYTYFSSVGMHDFFNDRASFTQVFGSTRQTQSFNAVRFQAGSNFTGGTFTLYGLSNS
jgi:hypothetical protein